MYYYPAIFFKEKDNYNVINIKVSDNEFIILVKLDVFAEFLK